MLDEGRNLAAERGIMNINWRLGGSRHLDGLRYLLTPQKAFRNALRIFPPGLIGPSTRRHLYPCSARMGRRTSSGAAPQSPSCETPQLSQAHSSSQRSLPSFTSCTAHPSQGRPQTPQGSMSPAASSIIASLRFHASVHRFVELHGHAGAVATVVCATASGDRQVWRAASISRSIMCEVLGVCFIRFRQCHPPMLSGLPPETPPSLLRPYTGALLLGGTGRRIR